MYVASGAYPWLQLYEKAGRPFDLAETARICSDLGYDGFEPMAETADAVVRTAETLESAGLQMRSAYANAALHDPATVESELARCAAIAERGRDAGLQWLVVNPVPIDWNAEIDKSDEQLGVQLDAIRALGAAVGRSGVRVAYHTHSSEMRASARELHHMLLNTTNEDMTWCLDADWLYRGSGMSRLAVYDLTALYADRISMVHIRQSINGVWTDAAAEGDLDYPKIAATIDAAGGSPLLVAEQIANDPGAAFAARSDDATRTLASIRTWFAT